MSKSSLAIFPDSVVMRESIRQATRRRASAPAARTYVGEWELRCDDNGDLVAVHPNGVVKTIAVAEGGS